MSGRSAGALAEVFVASSMWTAASTLISALERVAPDANDLIARQHTDRARLVDRNQLQANPGRRLGAGGSA